MLSFIPTPIGNTQDITLRALDLMRNLQIFLCEDTRTTKKLFNIYDISLTGKQFFPLPQWWNANRLHQIEDILHHQHCGVLSEAGSPWLSDPGKILIKYAHEHNIDVEVLPGATALIPAVIAAPTDTSSFLYAWFPPAKKWRKTFFSHVMTSTHPVFFYESVHRVEKALSELQDLWYNGHVAISREISKKFEQHVTGTCADILAGFADGTIPLKWEFVVCLYA